MDLGTNLRGFGHKPASKGQGSGFSLVFAGVGGPGFRFFTGFVPKSTKVCAQIHEGHEHYKGSRLRGFGHKPSWIWAQTFVDLGTNLRGFGHKPSWIWAQAGLEGPGFRFFTGVGGPGFQVFHWLFRVFTGCSAFPRTWGLQGSGFSLFFFFTGSKGQGSGFSLASRRARVQVFHWY